MNTYTPWDKSSILIPFYIHGHHNSTLFWLTTLVIPIHAHLARLWTAMD